MKLNLKTVLGRYVQYVETHAIFALLVIGILTSIAALYSYNHFTVNSSLDGLIQPTKENQWYTDNELYKKIFPQYQNTAVVVVSSFSAKQALNTGESVYSNLKKSGKFSDVFAPVYDSFFKQHILYNLPTEGVRRMADEVKKHLPEIMRLYKTPSIINTLDFYKEKIQDDKKIEVFTPSTQFFLTAFNKALLAIRQGRKAEVQFIQPLEPRDTGEIHYQLIIVKSHQDFSSNLPNKATIDNIRQAISNADVSKDAKVTITGEVALANDEITAGLSGVELSGTISLVLLFLILFLGVRYKRLISGIFLMLFIGMTWTSALGTFVVGAFNTLSLIFLVMFFGLAVDFAVHYALRWLESEPTTNTGSAAVETTRDIGPALLLCALTSSVAFLAFLPTAYKGLAELGMISAMGMMVAFLLTLSFLPAWFAVFRKSRPLKPLKLANRYQTSFKHHSVFVVVAGVIFIGVGVWFARQVVFDYSVLAMQDEKTEAMTTLTALQKHEILTDYGISVILGKNDDKKVIINQLKNLPTVAKVVTPEQFIPRFQAIKRGYMASVNEALDTIDKEKIPSAVVSPQSSHDISQFVTFLNKSNGHFYDEDHALLNDIKKNLEAIANNQKALHALSESIAAGIRADVNTLQQWFSALPFTLNDLPASVKSRFMTADGDFLINVLPSVDMTDRTNMTNFIEQVAKVSPNVAGRSVVEWGVGETVKKSFIEATSIAVILIFLMMIVYFRSIKLSLLVLIPIIMTSVFIFSVIHFTGLTLNMANILVVPLIFGLGVDTGLHVIHRYENSENMDSFAGSSTSRAVVISALTTIGTFFSLSLSPHKGAASIGIVLSLSIAFLLVATFVMLPALLNIFRSKQSN